MSAPHTQPPSPPAPSQRPPHKFIPGAWRVRSAHKMTVQMRVCAVCDKTLAEGDHIFDDSRPISLGTLS